MSSFASTFERWNGELTRHMDEIVRRAAGERAVREDAATKSA